MRILAISGSLRASSSNTELLRAAGRLAPAGIDVVLYDGLDRLPHFNPDVEETALPGAVAELRAAVAKADGILISSPEYAHGVPGALKNALDWLVGGVEFVNKPVALLNASPRSTFAHAQLAETVRTMSGRLVKEASPALPISGSGLDAHGIVVHPELAERLRAALAAFAAAIESGAGA